MANSEFSNHSFKNVTQGPKGVHAKDGVVFVEPGQELELDVTDGELASAGATLWFEVDGDAPKAPVAHVANEDLAGKSLAELKAIAKAEGADITGLRKGADLVAAIQLQRESKPE